MGRRSGDAEKLREVQGGGEVRGGREAQRGRNVEWRGDAKQAGR